jgi:hypothetical protein
MKLEFFRQIFEKYSNIKFNENMPNGSRVFPCERIDGWTYEQTDIHTKLIVASRSFAKALKKYKRMK